MSGESPEGPESAPELGDQQSLVGRFLVAMPGMGDSMFGQAIIYLIDHGQTGANGLMVNRDSGTSLKDLFQGMNIRCEDDVIRHRSCGVGGPVDSQRGFILFRPCSPAHEDAVSLGADMGVTGSRQLLCRIAEGRGPEDALVLLGFCSWAQGQLERELGDSQWLLCPVDLDLIFRVPLENRWSEAMRKLGVVPSRLHTRPVFS